MVLDDLRHLPEARPEHACSCAGGCGGALWVGLHSMTAENQAQQPMRASLYHGSRRLSAADMVRAGAGLACSSREAPCPAIPAPAARAARVESATHQMPGSRARSDSLSE